MSGEGERFRIPDASIRLDSMPAAGRDLNLVVDKPERDVLAETLDVVAIDRLEVKLHAVRFRGGIRVTGRLNALVETAEDVALVVSDNGPGLPEHFGEAKSGSLGQGILQSLASQLHGTISFERGPGTIARLTFHP